MNSKSKAVLTLVAIVSLAAFSVFASTFAPATRAQDQTGSMATVRFVHVYSGGGPIDIYVDGTKVVSQLAFGTATEYASFPSGDRKIQVVGTGGAPSSALIDKTITVDQGKAYNILISGQKDKLDARSVEVNLDSLDTGKARLRFVQGEPGAGKVDIALTAPTGNQAAQPAKTNGFPTFNNVSDTTDYQTVDAGTYGMTVTSSGESNKVNLPDIELSSGHVYDVVVLGQISSNNLTLLPLITAVSSPCSDLVGVGQKSDACVRFVHVSPDAGQVDVYVDGKVAAQGISYGAATEFAAVSGQQHQVQVTEAGQSTSNALLDETYGFGPGQAYQISILGMKSGDNGLKLLRDEIDLTPLPPQQARVRVIQAIPDESNVTLTTSAGDAKLLDSKGFGDESSYTTIDAGKADLTVTGSDNAQLVKAAGQEFKEGTAYDIFIIGRKADPTTLKLLVLETATTVRTGAQGTPVTVPTEGTMTPAPAGQVTPTVVGGSEQMTPTEVGAATVVPVLTEQPTSTEVPTPTP
jgi:hypothetical protein